MTKRVNSVLSRASGACLGVLLAGCRPPAPPLPEVEPRVPDALYFVLVDRFANGDPRNDGAIDRADPSAFHGGDLAGVRQALPGLAELGVSALWLSPVTAFREEPLNGHGAFHGYWLQDPYAVAPRLGTIEIARALVDESHQLGVNVLWDMVFNHLAYDHPYTRERPDWFHRRGDVVNWDDPQEAENHDVHGLPDLAQENPEVRAWLLGAARYWLDQTGADGLRIDAVRHLPAPFLAEVASTLREEFGPQVALLGEHFEGHPARLAERTLEAGLTSVFDFPLHYALQDVACRDAHPGRIASVLAFDPAYGEVPGPEPRPGGLARWVTFLDNHDTPRIATVCGGDLDRVAQALALQLTARGTPCLFQGTEHGQTGQTEAEARADYRPQAHPLRETVAGLLDLRARWAPLREGATRVLAATPEQLATLRVTDQAAVLVVSARGEGPVDLEPPAWLGHAAPVEAWTVQGAGPLVPALAEGGQVPAGATGLLLLRGEFSAVRAQIERPSAVEVAVSLRTGPLPAGATLALTGLGAPLGNWDPASAPAADPEGRVRWTGAEGSVWAVKPVLRLADGAVVWADQPDAYAVAGQELVLEAKFPER